MGNEALNIGTCSWKYDSWKGLVYPENKDFNYLQEYSRHFNCVEIDQWFWSLFPGDKIVLPKEETVAEYLQSVPASFTFGIKVANSITLTHHYKKAKADQLTVNSHFLSYDLMMHFLDRVAPLVKGRGMLMFQFEYLNKLKMPGGMRQFTDQLAQLLEKLPGDFTYCIESRNPNYLGRNYFQKLQDMNGHHVFLQGYYMPSIFELYSKFQNLIEGISVIRMLGPDRKGIEKLTGKKWGKIVAPQDGEIANLTQMLTQLESRGVTTTTFINNHFEGSAPKTIERIRSKLISA